MRVKDYEYMEYDALEEEETLDDERKEKIIERIKKQISKKKIALNEILKICKNEEELDFIYKWLARNEITIRGTNDTLSGELENYENIKKLGEVELPKPLDEGEQQRLFLKLNSMKKNGVDTDTKEYQDIRQKLTLHNMRLALWAVTVKYGKYLREFNIEEDDLKQIALESLIKSIDKYDTDYGCKFSTYAVQKTYYEVRRKWREEINNSDSKRKDWKRLELFKKEMLESIKREPTDEEIKEFLGISDKGLKSLKQYINYHLQEGLDRTEDDEDTKEGELLEDDGDIILGQLPNDERIEELGSTPILNGVYIDDEDGDELTAEEDIRRVDIAAQIPVMREDLKKALESLTPREKEVLELRFGLDGLESKTLEEVRT